MVECECSLWKEAVPEVEWELWISAAETSDEVVLKGLDGTFGRIASVDSCRCFLECYVLIVDVVFEEGTAFVIKHVEFGGKTSTDENVMYSGEGFNVVGRGSIEHWMSVDGVAVIMIEDEDVVVALTGWEYESSSLI